MPHKITLVVLIPFFAIFAAPFISSFPRHRHPNSQHFNNRSPAPQKCENPLPNHELGAPLHESYVVVHAPRAVTPLTPKPSPDIMSEPGLQLFTKKPTRKNNKRQRKHFKCHAAHNLSRRHHKGISCVDIFLAPLPAAWKREEAKSPSHWCVTRYKKKSAFFSEVRAAKCEEKRLIAKCTATSQGAAVLL